MIREDKVEKAIEIIKHASNLGYGIVIEGDTKKINKALDIAIGTMQKYQKIEEIKHRIKYTDLEPAKAYELINEVIEDGNDD